jgi:hypothetical protein
LLEIKRKWEVLGLERRVIVPTRGAKHWLGFSPSARNFISVFDDPPPCVDDQSLAALQSSDQGALALAAKDQIAPAFAIAVGEAFFSHWLTWGDGFHLTSGNVASFVESLERVPKPHLESLSSLGRCLLHRRHEALAFKRNAGKYVGNFNYRGHAWLTRRADLVLLAGLGVDRSTALEVFEHVQRVLAINEFAGEKSIPSDVKAKYRPKKVDEEAEKVVLDEADWLIKEHFGFTAAELRFLYHEDVSYGRNGEEDDA